MKKFLISLALIFLSSLSHSNELMRPSDFSEMDQFQSVNYVRVQSAKVAWADYAILKRDFVPLRDMSPEQIDQWILDSFAYISDLQLKLQDIRSSKILFNSADKKVFAVPPDYGRASVARVFLGGEALGLIDLKGTGHTLKNKVDLQINKFRQVNHLQNSQELDKLRVFDHSDGLVSLGEAIAETTRQRAVQMEFDILNAQKLSQSYLETVENYFIISLGFDILKDNGKGLPAAIVGRQSHFRQGYRKAVPPNPVYVDPHGRMQSTDFGASVDFGGVLLTTPELAKTFGVIDGGDLENPQHSKPWAWGHETAEYFAQTVPKDEAQARAAVDEHIHQMLAPIQQQWQKVSINKKSNDFYSYMIVAKALELSGTLVQKKALKELPNIHFNFDTPEVNQSLLKIINYMEPAMGLHYLKNLQEHKAIADNTESAVLLLNLIRSKNKDISDLAINYLKEMKTIHSSEMQGRIIYALRTTVIQIMQYSSSVQNTNFETLDAIFKLLKESFSLNSNIADYMKSIATTSFYGTSPDVDAAVKHKFEVFLNQYQFKRMCSSVHDNFQLLSKP